MGSVSAVQADLEATLSRSAASGAYLAQAALTVDDLLLGARSLGLETQVRSLGMLSEQVRGVAGLVEDVILAIEAASETLSRLAGATTPGVGLRPAADRTSPRART